MTSTTEEARKACNLYDYQLALNKAFQLDCEEFLEKFKQKQTNSYKEFSEIWREMRFSSIFQVETKVNDLENFLGNCFVLLKRFLDFPDHSRRICAFFLLYGIYMKQPIRKWVKIRLTIDEFRKTNEIAQTNDETKYLFKQLLANNAFQFVAVKLPLELYQEYSKRSNNDLDIFDSQPKFEVREKNDKFLENLEINEYETIENDYQLLLNDYLKENSEDFACFKTNLAGNLKAILQTNEVNKDEHCLNEKREVKKRAVKNKKACYRAERKVLTSEDLLKKS